MLRFTNVTVSGEVEDEFGDRVAVESTASTRGFGLANAGSGLGFGVGLDDNILLGARIAIANETVSYEDSLAPDADATVVTLEASPEFLVGGGPFVAPLIGFESQTASSGGVDTSTSLVVLGARFGVYAFVSDGASLDPALTVRYATGSTDLGGPEFDASGFQVLATFGVSAWLGGKDEPKTEPQAEGGAEAAPVAPSAPPRHAEMSSEAGTRRLTLPIGRSQRMTLSWDVVDADVFEFGLFLKPPAEPCRDVTLGLDPPAKLEVVKTGRAAVGFSGEGVFIQGRIDAGTLDDTRKSKRDVILDACGYQVVLGDGARRLVKSFLRDVVKARARAGLGPLKRREKPEPDEDLPEVEGPEDETEETPEAPPSGEGTEAEGQFEDAAAEE